jgi:hypothetical protein
MDTQINKVYIFPDTLANDDVVFPLVQVFEQIVHLSPVENDPSVNQGLSELQEQMVERAQLTFDCPAPLDEDRDRFLLLVHDLWQRPGEYAGQLNNLSLAGLGSSSPESKNSIISTLLRQTGIRENATGQDNPLERAEQDQQRQMILWQARLLLKLAEIFDREQETLQKSLHKISAKENGLFAELRKEEQQPTVPEPNPDPLHSQKTYSQLRLRLKAWSRLFALGKQPAVSPCFVTTSRDALDLLLEQYSLHQDRDNEVEPFLQISLPLPAGKNTLLDQLEKFQEDGAEILTRIRELLHNPAALQETDMAMFGDEKSLWSQLLETHYPAAESGRSSLTLYFLPDQEAGSLFLETFGRDEDELPRPEPGQTGMVTALLAIKENP